MSNQQISQPLGNKNEELKPALSTEAQAQRVPVVDTKDFRGGGPVFSLQQAPIRMNKMIDSGHKHFGKKTLCYHTSVRMCIHTKTRT